MQKRLLVTRVLKPTGQEPIDLVREMAKMRQELASELQANLAQLREVIKESERIASKLDTMLQHSRIAPVVVPGFRRRQREADRQGS